MYLLLLLSNVIFAARAFSIAGLTVEGLPCTDPAPFPSLLLAVDAPRPRFGWTLVNATAPQRAYRILVSLARTGAPVWDSGEVPSAATSQVAYEGAPLPPDTPFTLSITSLLSGGGGGGATSAPAAFSTALPTPADWRGAAWVGGGGLLRTVWRGVPAGARVARAVAHVTGVGLYELCVNGVVVNRLPDGRATALNPGFSTVFSERVLYQSWDVASALIPGAPNVVGLRLGSGKYGYLGEFCVGNASACNAAILSLSLDMADGAKGGLVTAGDGSWQAAQGSVQREHLYNGELVDGGVARALEGWCTPAFAPGAQWRAAAARPAPTASLSAHAFPPITSWEPAPRAPVTVAALKTPGSFLFDLGRNGAAALCGLEMPGPLPPRAAVTLTFAETLDASGEALIGFLCPAPCCADGGNCANQSYTYVTAGGAGAETYNLSFAYPAFRWVQVDGWPSATLPGPSALSCWATSTGVAAAGGVHFNDTVLDGLQAMVVNTQRSNFHSIPTDCPHREKRGWMADAHVSAPQAVLNLDLAPAYENWLRTHADTQAVSCGPLPPNATCPKWHNSQPQPGNWFNEALSLAGDEPAGYPNCYICCYGRSGFGCDKNTPINATGAIADGARPRVVYCCGLCFANPPLPSFYLPPKRSYSL